VSQESPLQSPPEPAAVRLSLVGRIADDLAHEIRNPLHSMNINLEVLRRGLGRGDVDMALARAAVLDTELLRLQQLIAPLIELLRPRAEGTRVLDLGAVLAQVAPLLEARARAARCRLEIASGDEEHRVRAAPDELRFAVLAMADAALAGCAADEVIEIRVEGTVDRCALVVASPASAEAGPVHAGHVLQLAGVLLDDCNGRIVAGTTGTGDGARFTATMTIPRETTAA
jgi:signal transduction histidine kinase